MLKVCSYRRSGTHYLMALMAKNFRFKDDLEMEMYTEDAHKWATSDKTLEKVPWGKLFDTHKEYSGAEIEELIYIYRHPVEVFRSLWEFEGKPGTINEFVTDKKITDWRKHVESYINAGVFPVRYDYLCALPVRMLTDIGTYFGLKLVDGEYHPVKERVGWKGKAKILDREGYSLATLDLFRDILGSSYRGFKL